MTIEAESGYRYIGGGGSLALEVSGPTLESCLARAVEAACGDVHPSVVGRRVEYTVEDGDPATMLREVLAWVSGLRADGEIPVRVEDATADGERVVVAVEVARPAGIRVLIDAAPEVDWHHVALERRDGQWIGRLVTSRPSV